MRINTKIKRTLLVTVACGSLVFTMAACQLDNTSSNQQAAQTDSANNATQLQRYQANQPQPQYDWSQIRQTLIDVEAAQVHSVATTTFFFNQGVQTPIRSCPSIGFPVASTTELSAPDQAIPDPHATAGSVVVGQSENTGVFPGASSGTYTVCVTAKGLKEIVYWEGFVHTEGGSAHWDSKTGQIALDGDPTATTSTK